MGREARRGNGMGRRLRNGRGKTRKRRREPPGTARPLPAFIKNTFVETSPFRGERG